PALGVNMCAENGLLLDFHSPCGKYVLTFDDDGKVAYGYLKENKVIVGDVWLYNRCQTPARPEWNDRNNIPFANCTPYASEDGTLAKVITANDIRVDWKQQNERPAAYIYLFNELYGVVGVNDKPGYARLAAKDGPLARVLIQATTT